MREEWAEKLRLKLEGHRMTPPEGLWEAISDKMGLNAEPVSKPTVIRRWWWAAAAVVLVLVGFFVFDDNKEQQETSHQPEEIIPSVSKHDTESPLLAKADEKIVPVTENLSEEILPDSAIDSHIDAHIDAHIDVPQNTDEPQSKKEKIINYPEPQYEHVPKHRNTNHDAVKWSVGLSASSGLIAANTSQRLDRIYRVDKPYYDSQSIFTDKNSAVDVYTTSYALTEYVSDHHLPIRFAVSLNYQLTPRIAVLSGISYTYLYSKFSIPLYQNISYDQKLHYLGIPLGLSYQLWSANNFHIYVSGGVMLEKCLNEKPWQWSIDVSAGAEYSFTRQFGFYVEPSLGYYFKDGTSFEHYYKEHPLTPSIIFGLRFHL